MSRLMVLVMIVQCRVIVCDELDSRRPVVGAVHAMILYRRLDLFLETFDGGVIRQALMLQRPTMVALYELLEDSFLKGAWWGEQGWQLCIDIADDLFSQ